MRVWIAVGLGVDGREWGRGVVGERLGEGGMERGRFRWGGQVVSFWRMDGLR